ncbi:hypothetical protein [Malikia granosa]|nr:hypothetical protein [Malikia granosa]
MQTMTLTASEAAGLKRASLRALVGSSDVRLASGPKLALIAIARCHDDRAGRSTCSLKTIAVMSGVGEKQAARNVEALVALGLVRRIPRQGRSTAYVIDLAALAAFETCRRDADQPAEPRTPMSGVGADTLDICDADPGHLEPPPRTLATSTPDIHVHRTERVLIGTEGGTEARVPAPEPMDDPVRVEAIPSLPPIESLQAGNPLPAAAAPQHAGPATEQPAAPAVQADPLATAAELLPAYTAPLFRALNARRVAAGKQPLRDRDVRDLAAEAEAAGRSLASLVELIDARGWVFARADWKGVRQEAAPGRARPDELSAQAQAAAAIRAAAVSTSPMASAETRARYAAQLAAQRAAIAAKAVSTSPDAVAGLDLTGQPAWVVENVRKLRAGLPVGHMARTRTAEMLGVGRRELEGVAMVVEV